MTKPVEVKPPAEKQVVVVLSQVQLDALEKRLPKPFVTNTVTDLQAGFLLGIAAVLKELRDGFTVGR